MTEEMFSHDGSRHKQKQSQGKFFPDHVDSIIPAPYRIGSHRFGQRHHRTSKYIQMDKLSLHASQKNDEFLYHDEYIYAVIQIACLIFKRD